MTPIRTDCGKFYGVLDEQTYWLYIKDGKDTRVIVVPVEGLTLLYITGDKPPEKVFIPPKTQAV